MAVHIFQRKSSSASGGLCLDSLPIPLLHGYYVFTTFRWPIQGQWLSAHLHRLVENAGILGLPFSWKEEDIHQWLSCLISDQEDDTWIVRLMVFPEVSERSCLLLPESFVSSCLAVSLRKAVVWPTSVYLKTVEYERFLPQVKFGGNLGDALFQTRQARQAGFDDVLWVNTKGHVTESATANFFGVKGQQVYTADPARDGCLSGITRHCVLQGLSNLGWEWVQQPLKKSCLAGLDGAFLTNAGSGVVAVAGVDGVDFHCSEQLASAARQLLPTERDKSTTFK